MDTTTLKKFAQGARRQLLEQVSSRMEQVLRSDSVEIREKAKVVEQLKAEIEAHGKIAVIDRVAYTWFNRFCALRFMDVNHYTRIGAVSPVEGGTQPEVLLEAKQGHVDEELARFVNPQVIFSLLNGQRPASDPQGEAYRLLLVGACNSYSEVMPFLFEKIEDYTELLMPLDLLSENSVLHDLREALSPEACEDVEVIGWLYQYYISERKDKVFEALKQNQKIEAGDIPAATQLFTPHWIVRYLVENSLGRLWMLNHPNSGLREKMEYYIEGNDEGGRMKDEEGKFIIQPSSFILLNSPEEIKLLDPACGSGHILTYAFDLLAAIYEEEGYASSDVAKLILEKNIFGVEIDPRAGALAAFALVMKARAKDRRFFTRDVSPNICVLENVTFNDAELKQYMNAVGRDLFTEPLMETLRQFEQADNFGSLIRPMLTDAGYVRGLLEGKNLGGDMFYTDTHKKVLQVLRYAEFLAPRYHAVVANPPYMGSSGMNDVLNEYAKDTYPNSKADLFAMFIERGFELIEKRGYNAMVTMQSWMFISSYEELRSQLLNSATIECMVHMANMVMGIAFGTAATVWQKNFKNDFISQFSYVSYADLNEDNKPYTFPIKNKRLSSATAHDLKKIPGFPIAYWISDKLRNAFEGTETYGDKFDIVAGISTGENEKYILFWHEVQYGYIKTEKSGKFLYTMHNKGGAYRKWYGNREWVLKYSEDAISKMMLNAGFRHDGKAYYFKEMISWSKVTSGKSSFRYYEAGLTFDSAGLAIFSEDKLPLETLGFLNSRVSEVILDFLNPTINVTPKILKKIPFITPSKPSSFYQDLIKSAQLDWDDYETSSNFEKTPVLNYGEFKTVSKAFENLYKKWKMRLSSMKSWEEENNHIFIEAYGLQDEMTSEVPLDEITLTCNPYYRYSGNNSEEELEALLLSDTMKEFISYAVGCMFGRYSLDKPGLVLANQGETLKDYLKQVPKPTFTPDEDNVIPVLEGEWFEDDIAERFKKFLCVTFGEEHYEENLAFIEEAIGRDVRSYFVKEFYKDHVQTYKKRPIYWMFSSPKGSFNALIYMHRYQPDTVSIVLNGYLREYIKKLTAHKSQLERTSVSGSASQSQKTKALKEITQVNKVLSELKEYEDDVLYPLATEQVRMDLDDGVKVNYGKFGAALSPIKGL
jgi:type II restriction/modification system DNA methylase subunit YeeA